MTVEYEVYGTEDDSIESLEYAMNRLFQLPTDQHEVTSIIHQPEGESHGRRWVIAVKWTRA